MIGIDGDGTENDALVKTWRQSEGMKYPMVSGKEGTGGAVFKSFGAAHYPTIDLVAPDKKIVEKEIEMKSSPSALDALVAKYVKPMGVPDQGNSIKPVANVRISSARELLINVSLDGEYTITMTNLQGRSIAVVRQCISAGNTCAISLPDQVKAQGVYMVKVANDNIEHVSKLVY